MLRTIATALLFLLLPVSHPQAHNLSGAQPNTYDRTAAVAFAEAHWNDAARIRISVAGITFYQADDCAYFASEVLWAGGLSQSPTWSATSTDAAKLSSRLADPGPTKTVMLADRLEKYLVSTGHATVTPLDFGDKRIPGAEVGDLVAYDWNHNGVIDHVSVVRSTGPAGTRIAQHNVNIRSQSWRWSSTAMAYIVDAYSHPRAYLVHITD